ncbi:MAG: biotin transporter BioY [Gemmatimonadales bacterium]
MNSTVAPSAAPVLASTRMLVARRAIAIALGAAAVALAAQLAIPIGPVPVSLQGGTVLLVGGLLGWRYGAAALLAYLAAGAAGLPVFANGGFSLAHLFGPTGGYLLAFPAAAALMGVLARPGNVVRSIGAALAAMIVIHLGGWAWLSIVLQSGSRAFALGTQPFLISDLLQVVLAGGVVALAAAQVRRRI